MRKAILFSVLLIIITLLSSCTNSERYHFSYISSGIVVSDSKTGKVYLTSPNNHEITWDPIKKTLTSDTLKSENQAVASDYKAPQQQESQRDSQTQFQQPTQTQSNDGSYTIQQLGQLVKAKYPKEYGSMSDSVAGAKLLSKYPQYDFCLKK